MSIRYGEEQWAGGGRKKGLPSNLIVSDPTRPPGAKPVRLQKGFSSDKAAIRSESDGEKPEGESDRHFPLGQRVYSDSYGPGQVVLVKDRNGKEIIDVNFDSGRKATFISRYASLEKIGND
jgi:hypothetical protein